MVRAESGLRRPFRDLPQPNAHPLWGNAPAFHRDVLGSFLAGLDHGDIVRYQFGPSHGPLGTRAVAVHHPAGVQQVLTQTERFYGKQTVGFDVLAGMLGHGLLTTEGAVWKRQRRTLQPLFTPRRVTGYADLMAGEARRVTSDVPAGEVDLHLLMLRYTLRVVGKALFGDDIDDVVPAMHRLVPLATDLVRERAFQLIRFPLSCPTRRNRRFRQARAELYGTVERILADRADGRTTDDRDDLVERLRSARDPDTGEPLSEQEVLDQALVFLLAGHETTAGALTFTLHLLGRHPDEQEAVAREVAEVLQGRPAPNGTDVPRLDRTRAALMEGMRLYPPAYITERVARVDTELEGYELPRGTVVFTSPWVTHRHPDYWPQPDRFDPGRFVVEQDRPRYAYFPFGGGPRSCIGEHFAMLEATILLATLLARYRVVALDERVRLLPQVTLRPAHEVQARLEPRTRGGRFAP